MYPGIVHYPEGSPDVDRVFSPLFAATCEKLSAPLSLLCGHPGLAFCSESVYSKWQVTSWFSVTYSSTSLPLGQTQSIPIKKKLSEDDNNINNSLTYPSLFSVSFPQSNLKNESSF